MNKSYGTLIRQYLRAKSRSERYHAEAKLDLAGDYRAWAREIMEQIVRIAAEERSQLAA